MKKVFLVFAILFLCAAPAFSQKTDIKNDVSGFRMIINGHEVVIDKEPRTMSNYNCFVSNNTVTINYTTQSRIKKTGMVIIKSGHVVFDSKSKVRNDAHDYMGKIYVNLTKKMKFLGVDPGPEFSDFNIADNSFYDDRYTYRTYRADGRIMIDINFDSNYQKYIRLLYADKDNYELLKIINNSGIVVENRFPIAIICDPDGYTNVRSGPGKDHSIIEKIRDGEIFAIVKWGKWCKIITPTGKNGFVHQSRVKKIK